MKHRGRARHTVQRMKHIGRCEFCMKHRGSPRGCTDNETHTHKCPSFVVVVFN